MLRRVVLASTDVSEERMASSIRVKSITELGKVALIIKGIYSSETTVLRRTTPRYISEDGILHSHRHENLYLK
jgi:hypothetical protein